MLIRIDDKDIFIKSANRQKSPRTPEHTSLSVPGGNWAYFFSPLMEYSSIARLYPPIHRYPDLIIIYGSEVTSPNRKTNAMISLSRTTESRAHRANHICHSGKRLAWTLVPFALFLLGITLFPFYLFVSFFTILDRFVHLHSESHSQLCSSL